MGRSCGEPDEIKKNTHPKDFTALFRPQADATLVVSSVLDTLVYVAGALACWCAGLLAMGLMLLCRSTVARVVS